MNILSRKTANAKALGPWTCLKCSKNGKKASRGQYSKNEELLEMSPERRWLLDRVGLETVVRIWNFALSEWRDIGGFYTETGHDLTQI